MQSENEKSNVKQNNSSPMLQNMTPQISVVMTTYNEPAWLRLVLWGFAYQQLPEDVCFELLVADDGSRQDTADLIEELRPQLPYKLHHIWHEDKGFRKCEILNKAFVQTKGEYIVVTDGDCIPRPDFLATHYNERNPQCFLSGGAVRLPLAISKAITREIIYDGSCFHQDFLNDLAIGEQVSSLKLRAKGLFAKAMNRITTARASWNGGNSSCFRAALFAVGGMDERMKYGGEDREFGERLVNYGLRGKHVRYTAIALHLEHNRGYVTKENWDINHKIRAHTRRAKVIHTPYGIKEVLLP